MIFLTVLPKKFSVAPLLGPTGAPGARGPRFIEPPEPLVPTPLVVEIYVPARSTAKHGVWSFPWAVDCIWTHAQWRRTYTYCWREQFLQQQQQQHLCTDVTALAWSRFTCTKNADAYCEQLVLGLCIKSYIAELLSIARHLVLVRW